MRVICNKALTDFSSIYPAALAPLQAWRKIVESRTYASFADIKTSFNAADKVDYYCVFDIVGNKYRIVTAIHFDDQTIYIRHVLTDKEYDKWKP